MTSDTVRVNPQLAEAVPSPRGFALIVVCAAIAMGIPTLTGNFLGGDDILLVRDHVLVNRPSLDHAIELVSVVHRDLYQPLPMLSFSLDFAIIRALGLGNTTSGTASGVWLFHLTNTLFHALNAWLVYRLGLLLLRRAPVAAFAAMIFAVHPLNMETVAWINGRMMLMSTAFLLAAAYTLERWRQSGGAWRIALVLLFTTFCMMSKVRVALPVLLAIPLLLHWQRPKRNWWLVWIGASLITAAFVAFNLYTSKEMVAAGEAQWTGPSVARIVPAISWYLTRAMAPFGLCPYHPPSIAVHWSDPGLWIGAGVLLIVLAAVVISARYTRIGWVGLLWFAAAIFSTLPWISARNQFVAERYTYLPHIGLYWILAALACAAGQRWLKPSIRGFAAAGVAIALFAVSCQTAGQYHNDVARSSRMMALYADEPGIATKHAWALYHDGQYDRAVDAANHAVELSNRNHWSASEQSDAWQALGMAHWQAHDVRKAIAALRNAVELTPANGAAWTRLARVMRSAGQSEQALAALERGVELAPGFNPGLLELASAYHRAGRFADARRVYEQALSNNAFEVQAILGLAELDIAAGNQAAALARLDALLEWMPQLVPAHINAGICLATLGQPQRAMQHYRTALELDPSAAAAAMNLASLLSATGQVSQAAAQLDAFLQQNPHDRDPLLLAVELHVRASEHRQAALLLIQAMPAQSSSAELQGWYAWVSWLAGQWDVAAESAETALAIDPMQQRARMVQCALYQRQNRPEAAVAIVQALLAAGELSEASAFDAFAAVLQTYAGSHPEDPWPYYILALACQQTGRAQMVPFAVEECLKRTADPALRKRAQQLIKDLEPSPIED